MTRYSDGGFAVILAFAKPAVQAADMGILILVLAANDAVGCLDKSPFQVMVRNRGRPAKPDLATARLNCRNQARIASQVLWRGKAMDVANLEIDRRRENIADTRKRLQQSYEAKLPNAELDPLLQFPDVRLSFVNEHPLVSCRVAMRVCCGNAPM